MWPSRICHFRIYSCSSVKLSVFPPSWWSSTLYALNLEMPLTELYMGRPLWALYFVVNLNPPKTKWASSFSVFKPSPMCPVCFPTCCGQMIRICKPVILKTPLIITSIFSFLSIWKIQPTDPQPATLSPSEIPFIVTSVNFYKYLVWNKFHQVLHKIRHWNRHKSRKSRCQPLFSSYVFLEQDSSVNLIRGINWFLDVVLSLDELLHRYFQVVDCLLGKTSWFLFLSI